MQLKIKPGIKYLITKARCNTEYVGFLNMDIIEL